MTYEPKAGELVSDPLFGIYAYEPAPKPPEVTSQPKYNNPTPVAVHLQEVICHGHRGLLLIQRADNGEWALPGGYIESDLDQSAESAAAREFREELGVDIHEGKLFWSQVTPNGKLLIFVRSTVPFFRSDVPINFEPTSEVLDVRVAYRPEELCYPAHTEAMKRWFMSVNLSSKGPSC